MNNFEKPTAKDGLECTICQRLRGSQKFSKHLKNKGRTCSKYETQPDHGQSSAILHLLYTKEWEFEKWIFKGGKNRLFGNFAKVLVRQFLYSFISLRKRILVTFKVKVRLFSRLFQSPSLEGWSGQPKYSNTFYIHSTLHRFHETESHLISLYNKPINLTCTS